MQKIVVANWKSHKTLPEAIEWLEQFSQLFTPDPQVQVILAPPMPYVAVLRQLLLERYNSLSLALAVQDISPFPLGSYTGAVAAEMLSGLVEYAIVGHSERRRYFHETNQEIANKVRETVAVGIRPIVCVDLPYARSLLNAMDEAEIADLIIGYGPIEAIGIDLPQSSQTIRSAIKEIEAIAPGRPIVYGGSVQSANAAGLMELAGLSGLLVGTASLPADEFVGICKAVAQAGQEIGSLRPS